MKQLFLTLTFILFVIPFGISQDIILNGSVSVENNQIKNVGEPTENKDVTTKNYVDELIENQQINNGKVYVFRVDYDIEALSGSQGSITQITDYGFSSGTVNFNHNVVSSVIFDFVDESQPPVTVTIYGYQYGSDGNTKRYNFGHTNYNADSYVQFQTNTNNLVSGDVQTDLLSAFNNASVKLDLTPSRIGASAGSQGFVNVNAHAYLFFRF